MTPPATPGVFITFEGGDGAGKSTVLTDAAAHLTRQGYPVTVTRAPGGSSVGSTLRSLLLDRDQPDLGARTEPLLFAADMAAVTDQVIRPALTNGRIVLCDRYADSTVAYQGVARGLGVEDVTRLTKFATGDLTPDLTVWLDLDPDVGLARVARSGTGNRMEDRDVMFHRRVRTGFAILADKAPTRIQRVSADADYSTVLTAVLGLVDRVVADAHLRLRDPVTVGR